VTRENPYAPGLMGGPKKREHGGRYDMREIAARVDRRRKQRGVTAKELYVDLGLERWDWSKKIRNAGSSFTVEELGRIADLLDAPPGWPFLSDDFWNAREVPAHVKPRH
jgi:hypothetical protein